VRRPTVSIEDTRVTVASVSPNDSPNVIGLRIDTGPIQVPPVPSSTPRCTSPLASSAAAPT
jgi:hypothetical protein